MKQLFSCIVHICMCFISTTCIPEQNYIVFSLYSWDLAWSLCIEVALHACMNQTVVLGASLGLLPPKMDEGQGP